MKVTTALFTLALAGFAAAEAQVPFDATTDFDPASYTFKNARCPAVNREKKLVKELEQRTCLSLCHPTTRNAEHKSRVYRY